MPLLLNKKFVQKIKEKALGYAKIYFGEKSLRGIIITFNFSTSIKLKFDKASRMIIVKVGRFVPISRHDLEKLLIYKILKILSYRFICPKDIRHATEIVRNAIEIADYALGMVLASLVIEVITNSDLLHFLPDLVVDALKIQRKLLGTEAKLTDLRFHLINLAYGEDVIEVTDTAIKNIAEEIHNIIFRRNIKDPDVWGIVTRDVSIYIKSILEDEEIKEEMQKFEKIMGFDPTESYLPMLCLQSSSNYEIILDAFQAVYGVSKGNLVVSGDLMLGSIALESKEILRLWYRQRARELVRVLIKEQAIMRRHKIRYPDTWSLGDDIEDLDVYLSSNLSPIMIPGYTTKKWEVGKSVPQRVARRAPDILIIIDSSGSMGKLHGYQAPHVSKHMKDLMKKLGITYVIGSKFDIAVLTAFGILEYALMLGCDVGVINFSSIVYRAGFSMNRNKLEDTIMIHQNRGTRFPISTIRKMLEGRRDVLVIILSDAAIYNRETASRFLEKIAREHTVYFFHIELPAQYKVLEHVKKGGGYIINIRDINELPKMAITMAEKHTRGFVVID